MDIETAKGKFNYWCKIYGESVKKKDYESRLEATENLMELIVNCVKQRIIFHIRISEDNRMGIKRIIALNQYGFNEVVTLISDEKIDSDIINNINNPFYRRNLIKEFYKNN